MIHSAHFVSGGRGLTARRDFHAPGADQTARTPRRRDRLSAASPAGLLPLPALACVAALALGLTATTAGAQDTILVTNNAQTTHTAYASVGVVAGFQYSGAQSFTTGAHANGYSLDSVRINSLGSNDRPVVTVSIHSNNSGAPGSELLQLIGGNSGVTSGLNNFRARGEILLAANTTYFVVVQGSVASSTFLTTAADAEDDNSAAGWSIGNNRLHRTADNVAWATQSNAMKLVIRGTPLTAGSPDAPRNLTAQAGNGQVTLQWMAPKWNGGSTITGYQYRQSTDGGDNWGSWTDITDSDDSTTEHTVESLTNGDTYTFQVRAENSEGKGAESSQASATPAGFPTAPQSLTAQAGDGQVTLEWMAPKWNGGSTITGYQYRQSTDGGDNWGSWTDITDSDDSTTEHTVESLTNGDTYTFQVRAENSEGKGAESSQASATPAGFPTAPQSLTAQAGDGQVTLEWTAPISNGGSTITGYQYRQSTDGGDNWGSWTDITDSDDSTTEHTVESLTNGDTYTFQVRAENSEGKGAPSSQASASPMLVASVPGRPRSLTGTSGNSQVTLQWMAPESNGGSTITGYQYRQSTTGGKYWNVNWTDIPDSDANTTSYTVKNLSNGATFTFNIRAKNALGTGKNTPRVHVIPTAVPNAPINLTAHAGDGQVTLEWSPPFSNGGKAITGYQYRQKTDSGNGWNAWTDIENSDENTISYTVESLANGTIYTFQVRAENSEGKGKAAREADATPAAGLAETVPTAPRGLIAQSGDRQATLQWTAPESDGGSAITGYQYRRSTTRGKFWTPDWTDIPNSDANTTSYTVGSLTNSLSYIFEVRARNASREGPASNQAKAIPAIVPASIPVSTTTESLPLTASFEAVPAAHDGANTFTFELTFSESPQLSYKVLRDESFSVTGGEVLRAQRLARPSNLRWRITVQPEGLGDVSIILPSGRACKTYGAICTADDRALSNTLTTTVMGPAALTVADATIQEAPGVALAFRVTLSRAAQTPVTVDYATADGTAHAGADYTAASGRLTFEPGETEMIVNVTVLDDAHDDGGETMYLILSNASGASIADAQASGVITNTDPLQQAWLARFGRTTAEHVVQMVGARIDGSPAGSAGLTLGGRQLFLDDFRPAEAQELRAFGSNGLHFDRPLPSGAARFPQMADGSPAQAVSISNLLLASSFHLASADRDARGRRWSVWGRGAHSGFNGADDGLSLDGGVSTGLFGADFESGKMLMGVALAYSAGGGSYTTAEVEGEIESTLASMHPYLRYAASGRVSLWSVLGLGKGELRIDPERSEERMETGLSMGMAAFGVRGSLLAGSDFDLAVKSDLLLVRNKSDAAAGLASADAGTKRLRVAIEGARDVRIGNGVLRPSLEVGLRNDAGEAETGGGLELGGALRYSSPRGFAMEVSARGLLAHEERDYKEWGVSASVSLAPGAGGRGLSIRAGSSWGMAASGVDRLWSQRTAAGLVQSEDFQPAGPSIDAEMGYGLDAMGGLLTPFSSLSLSEGAKTFRLGGRFNLGNSLRISLEGDRKENLHGQKPNHAVTLRGSLRW